MKNINELVFNMLTESTGTHFLDSGGDDGRHWQRNKKKSIDDFNNEKKVDYDIYFRDGKAKLDDISMTISLYHYLTDVFDTDDMCDLFNEKFNVMNDYDSDWNYISADAEKFLIDYEFKKQGDKINTYNYDNYLSQNVLFTHLKFYSDDYYLVSIHNGADVRGGYTDAKLFKLNTHIELPFNFSIYGTINGIMVSNTYNGYSLTIDDVDGNNDIDSDTFELNESDNNTIELEYYL